jgi:hypothetical protein
MTEIELVIYDPTEPDTFPSICHLPTEVEQRFGFKGGEMLVFTKDGTYVGELVRILDTNLIDEMLQPSRV